MIGMAKGGRSWASNLHFRPGEFNFLREVKNSGLDAALKASDDYFKN